MLVLTLYAVYELWVHFVGLTSMLDEGMRYDAKVTRDKMNSLDSLEQRLRLLRENLRANVGKGADAGEDINAMLREKERAAKQDERLRQLEEAASLAAAGVEQHNRPVKTPDVRTSGLGMGSAGRVRQQAAADAAVPTPSFIKPSSARPGSRDRRLPPVQEVSTSPPTRSRPGSSETRRKPSEGVGTAVEPHGGTVPTSPPAPTNLTDTGLRSQHPVLDTEGSTRHVAFAPHQSGTPTARAVSPITPRRQAVAVAADSVAQAAAAASHLGDDYGGGRPNTGEQRRIEGNIARPTTAGSEYEAGRPPTAMVGSLPDGSRVGWGGLEGEPLSSMVSSKDMLRKRIDTHQDAMRHAFDKAQPKEPPRQDTKVGKMLVASDRVAAELAYAQNPVLVRN